MGAGTGRGRVLCSACRIRLVGWRYTCLAGLGCACARRLHVALGLVVVGWCGCAECTRGCMSGASVVCGGRLHAMASICSLTRPLNIVSRNYCRGSPVVGSCACYPPCGSHSIFGPQLSPRWPHGVVGGALRVPSRSVHVAHGLLGNGA